MMNIKQVNILKTVVAIGLIALIATARNDDTEGESTGYGPLYVDTVMESDDTVTSTGLGADRFKMDQVQAQYLRGGNLLNEYGKKWLGTYIPYDDRGPGTWDEADNVEVILLHYPADAVLGVWVAGVKWPDYLLEQGFIYDTVNTDQIAAITLQRTTTKTIEATRDDPVQWLYATAGPPFIWEASGSDYIIDVTYTPSTSGQEPILDEDGFPILDEVGAILVKEY